MPLILNGKSRALPRTGLLADLIKEAVAQDLYVVAELNGQIVPRPAWPTTALKSGDHVELVHLVGGG